MAAVNIISLLKEKRLRLTPGRKEILEVLHDSRVALSPGEIEKKLSVAVDRITAYRTLLAFKEKGLVHTILDPQSATTKYCVNKPGLPFHHAHFKCERCHALTCLPVDIEKINLISVPVGFTAHRYSFFVEGLCNHCRLELTHLNKHQYSITTTLTFILC